MLNRVTDLRHVCYAVTIADNVTGVEALTPSRADTGLSQTVEV